MNLPISTFKNSAINPTEINDKRLIALFKIFSPEHLLKLPFVNDSNTLDKGFYRELLHIIGLTETTAGSKKLIERSKGKDRKAGSIIENTITRLDSLDIIDRMNKPSRFGNNTNERLFNVALELTITWMNRVLFLKLLEAQLLKYHNGNSDYAFLQLKKVSGYDDLNSLFFQVLAKPLKDRSDEVKNDFENIPYLNSSLFEPTDMERETIYIGLLKDDIMLPLHSQTVLKEQSGKRRKGEMATLSYLFEFLNAYDFSSEGAEEIQEENKTLINASVLGLIFEKINGYKDGSFFTPGYITMYMSRETIRRAFVQKINERIISSGHQNWKNLETITDVYNQIGVRIGKDSVNEVINNLKICDPAVGSGHFLVSALNELIALKSELRVLQDKEGKLLRNYFVEVVNDELIVTEENGELFEYNPKNKESRRIQETLFHEKQTIIENCLFGVDINSNSVKICRLRLWIELLKNAYYKIPSVDEIHEFHLPMELQTLPNIDINIKCGNSLISRFNLDSDLKKALKTGKWTIDSYRVAVSSYRNAKNKKHKREMENLISQIKQSFSTEIRMNDPVKKRLDKLANELYHRFTGNFLFEPEAPYGKNEKKLEKKRKAEQQKLEDEISKLSQKIEAIKNNKIYQNAFEWRFEFPEVLNDHGDFVGFDAVIGNPPYVRQEQLSDFKPYLKTHYQVFASSGDIFSYFYELSCRILRKNGYFSFINNTFDKTTAGKVLRTFVANHLSFKRYIDLTDVVVFDEATTYPIILIAQKAKEQPVFKFLKFRHPDLSQN